MPNNAQSWAQFLAKKPLPSPFRIGQLVLKKMDKGNLPYAKLASIVITTPFLLTR